MWQRINLTTAEGARGREAKKSVHEHELEERDENEANANAHVDARHRYKSQIPHICIALTHSLGASVRVASRSSSKLNEDNLSHSSSTYPKQSTLTLPSPQQTCRCVGTNGGRAA